MKETSDVCLRAACCSSDKQELKHEGWRQSEETRLNTAFLLSSNHGECFVSIPAPVFDFNPSGQRRSRTERLPDSSWFLRLFTCWTSCTCTWCCWHWRVCDIVTASVYKAVSCRCTLKTRDLWVTFICLVLTIKSLNAGNDVNWEWVIWKEDCCGRGWILISSRAGR